MSQPCDYLVVHCSASPNALSDGRFDSAGDIHRWHKERGFSGIGYHFVIDEHGEIHNGRPVFTGTRSFWVGAHVAGMNTRSIGICLIGNKTFHQDQLITLAGQLSFLKLYWPDAKIVGHCDLDPKKTCPNFDVEAFCKKWELQ